MASRVLGAFVVTGTAALISLALATPAFAHTPTVEVNCDEQGKQSVLSVTLKDYNTRKGQNTLTVETDGKQTAQVKFDENLSKQKWTTTSTEDHTYKVTVLASDDPNIEDKNPNWSRVFTLDNKKCVKTPPTETKTSEPTKPPVQTTTEAPSSSVTPPAPGGSTPEPPLAATGASPLWLLLSGLGLVGAGAGTLLFLRRRRSA